MPDGGKRRRHRLCAETAIEIVEHIEDQSIRSGGHRGLRRPDRARARVLWLASLLWHSARATVIEPSASDPGGDITRPAGSNAVARL
jgi:hypothetical protein